MKKIKNKKLKLIFIAIVLVMVVVAIINRSTITEYISGERKLFGASYSGTCGSSNWTINNRGKLVIQVGTLPNIDMQNRPEWYQYREYITSVQINGEVDTSDICEGLFQDCTNLESADLTNLNTSNSINLGHMFEGCTSLTTVDFGTNFVTNNTKRINNMFQNCSSLQTIDFSDFNTTNIIDMSYLLSGCTSLNTITWGSNFNTAHVTNFQGMFLNCENINSLDLSGFNTTNAISGNMKRMLEGMTKCNILILGNDFRFNKSSTTECQIFTTNDTIWKKSGTTTDGNSALLLENDTNPTGTWYRQYYITYYGNGGTSSNQPQNSNYATYSQSYIIGENEYTKKGYDFAGWTTNSDGSDDGNNWIEETINWNYTIGQKGIKCASTIELYAMWTPKQYTIVYQGNGGTWNDSNTRTETIFYGEKYGVPKGDFFAKRGHNYVNWKDSANNTWNDGTTSIWTYDNGQYGITNNTLTLTAQWAPRVYKIVYAGNAGTWNGQTTWSETAIFGQSYTIRSNFYTRRGYNFTNWRDPTGGFWAEGRVFNPWNYDNGEWGIQNDTLYIYAEWTPMTFTVVYHRDRDAGSPSWSETVNYDQIYKVWNNWYTNTGTFIGWQNTDYNLLWEESFRDKWVYLPGTQRN